MNKHKSDSHKLMKRLLRGAWTKHAHKWWKVWFDEKHPKHK